MSFFEKLESKIACAAADIRELHDNIWNAACSDERLDEAQYDHDSEHRDLYDTVESLLWNLYRHCESTFEENAKRGRGDLKKALFELEIDLLDALDEHDIDYFYDAVHQNQAVETETMNPYQLRLF